MIARVEPYQEHAQPVARITEGPPRGGVSPDPTTVSSRSMYPVSHGTTVTVDESAPAGRSTASGSPLWGGVHELRCLQA